MECAGWQTVLSQSTQGEERLRTGCQKIVMANLRLIVTPSALIEYTRVMLEQLADGSRRLDDVLDQRDEEIDTTAIYHLNEGSLGQPITDFNKCYYAKAG